MFHPASPLHRRHNCCKRTKTQIVLRSPVWPVLQPNGRFVIDFVGEVGIEVAKRIIGQTCQMKYRIKAFDIGEFDITNVLEYVGTSWVTLSSPKVDPSYEVSVDANNIVPRIEQHWHQNCADSIHYDP